MPAPATRALVAGPNGAAFNRFAWADPTSGQVSNALIAGGSLGIVLPQALRVARNGWTIATLSNAQVPGQPPPPPTGTPPYLILREGLMLELLIAGNFAMQFPDGCGTGLSVFASTTDGTAYTNGGGAGYVPTPWTTLASTGPYGRALISTYTPPF